VTEQNHRHPGQQSQALRQRQRWTAVAFPFQRADRRPGAVAHASLRSGLGGQELLDCCDEEFGLVFGDERATARYQRELAPRKQSGETLAMLAGKILSFSAHNTSAGLSKVVSLSAASNV